MAVRVSIVIPAYNADRFLADAIDSVRRQTFTEWELVVVDDGSLDSTTAVAEHYRATDSRVRTVRQENGGIAAARNRGADISDPTSEYIAFLDADDIWEPDLLAKLVGVLERSPQAVAAHGRLRRVGPDGQVISLSGTSTWPNQRRALAGCRLRKLPTEAPTTFAALAYSNFIPISGMVLRRAAKEAAGPFDGRTDMTADWDMWLRLSRHGDIMFVNDIVVNYRHSGTNYSLNRTRMDEAIRYVRRKILSATDLRPSERRIVRLGHRYFELHRCLQMSRNAGVAFADRRLSRGMSHAQNGFRHLWNVLRGI